MWEIFATEVAKSSGRTILRGLWATIQIAVLGLLIGLVIGTFIAIVRVMPKYKRFPKVLDFLANIYVGIFRGTPIVVQLLVGHFVLFPLLKINILGIYEAIIIFGFNSGAYISEIMRGGIQSVDIGQLEAGRAVGLPYGTSMRKVVVPQAFKNILPTLGNEFIALIKETAVTSFIAVFDLTKAFTVIGDVTYEYMVPYLMLALVYLVLIIIITILVRLVEIKLQKSDRKAK
jgi:polar amino acid transport system permease protein